MIIIKLLVINDEDLCVKAAGFLTFPLLLVDLGGNYVRLALRAVWRYRLASKSPISAGKIPAANACIPCIEADRASRVLQPQHIRDAVTPKKIHQRKERRFGTETIRLGYNITNRNVEGARSYIDIDVVIGAARDYQLAGAYGAEGGVVQSANILTPGAHGRADRRLLRPVPDGPVFSATDGGERGGGPGGRSRRRGQGRRRGNAGGAVEEGARAHVRRIQGGCAGRWRQAVMNRRMRNRHRRLLALDRFPVAIAGTVCIISVPYLRGAVRHWIRRPDIARVAYDGPHVRRPSLTHNAEAGKVEGGRWRLGRVSELEG